MVRNCEHCKSFDGTIAKVLKLKEPIVELMSHREVLYEHTMTHRCENCGCTYGEGKKKVGKLK